jgi:hypothetical protein
MHYSDTLPASITSQDEITLREIFLRDRVVLAAREFERDPEEQQRRANISAAMRRSRLRKAIIRRAPSARPRGQNHA